MPTLLVHGWWNISGAKMSKSLGNVVDPDALIEKYGAEALRYYLMSDIATGYDADFSEPLLVQRYNSELANNVGNLMNRVLTMAERYSKSVLTKSQIRDEATTKLSELAINSSLWLCEAIDQQWQFHSALGFVTNFVRRCNEMIEDRAPWKLAKMADKEKQLKSLLYALTEAVRIIGVFISPVLPRAAHGIFDQLNWKMELSGKEERFRLEDVKWGGLPDGHVLGKPVPLFPRIEG